MKLDESVVVAVAVVVVEPQTSRPFAWQTRNAKLAFTSKPLTYFVGGKHSIHPSIHSFIHQYTPSHSSSVERLHIRRHLIKTTTMPDPPPPSSAAARRPPQQQQQQQQRAGNLLGNANSQMLDSIVSGTNCETASVVAQRKRNNADRFAFQSTRKRLIGYGSGS